MRPIVWWLLCLLLSLPGTAFAHALAASKTDATQAQDANKVNAQQPLDDVAYFNEDFGRLLESDAYSDHYEYKKWQAKPKPMVQPVDSDDMNASDDFFLFLHEMTQSLAIGLKTVLLLLLVACVLWLLRYYGKLGVVMDVLLAGRRAQQVLPNFVHQKHLFAELPEHQQLAEVVAALIAKGDYLAALSMLYRGSLRVMKLTFALPISHSETEAQCQMLMHQARHQYPEEVAFFDRLVRLWQQAAYGKCLPTGDVRGELYALLDGWRRLYPSLQPSSNIQMDKQGA